MSSGAQGAQDFLAQPLLLRCTNAGLSALRREDERCSPSAETLCRVSERERERERERARAHCRAPFRISFGEQHGAACGVHRSSD